MKLAMFQVALVSTVMLADSSVTAISIDTGYEPLMGQETTQLAQSSSLKQILKEAKKKEKSLEPKPSCIDIDALKNSAINCNSLDDGPLSKTEKKLLKQMDKQTPTPNSISKAKKATKLLSTSTLVKKQSKCNQPLSPSEFDDVLKQNELQKQLDQTVKSIREQIEANKKEAQDGVEKKAKKTIKKEKKKQKKIKNKEVIKKQQLINTAKIKAEKVKLQAAEDKKVAEKVLKETEKLDELIKVTQEETEKTVKQIQDDAQKKAAEMREQTAEKIKAIKKAEEDRVEQAKKEAQEKKAAGIKSLHDDIMAMGSTVQQVDDNLDDDHS